MNEVPGGQRGTPPPGSSTSWGCSPFAGLDGTGRQRPPFASPVACVPRSQAHAGRRGQGLRAQHFRFPRREERPQLQAHEEIKRPTCTRVFGRLNSRMEERPPSGHARRVVGGEKNEVPGGQGPIPPQLVERTTWGSGSPPPARAMSSNGAPPPEAIRCCPWDECRFADDRLLDQALLPKRVQILFAPHSAKK